MDLGLDGRTAIVTGASVGIGEGIADALATEGCDVVICARGEDELDAAAEDLADREGDVVPVTADVTRQEDVDHLVDAARERFGGVDVLVNNAGTLGSESPLHEVTIEEWERVFDVNVTAAARTSKAALPDMREQGWGRIVNVASEAASQPDAFKPHYDASKAALVNLTKNLSKTYGEDGVRVNAVSPATTVTPLVEDLLEERAAENGVTRAEAEQRFLDEERPGIVADRLGLPEDVGGVVAFLASEHAEFVTGANYRVDGGSISTIDT